MERASLQDSKKLFNRYHHLALIPASVCGAEKLAGLVFGLGMWCMLVIAANQEAEAGLGVQGQPGQLNKTLSQR